MSVAAQHFPILVAGDKRDLFNGKPNLEKAARAFVTQIVKMKVIDLQFSALTTERCSNRSSVVRKNPAFANIRKPSLLLNDFASVIARYIQQRNSLVVALLLPGILPISNEEHSTVGVEVALFNSSNFVLPHCRRDCETNNTPNWNLLPDIRVQRRDDPVEFILSGTTVTLVPFPDEAEPSKGNAGKIDWFS